MNSKLSVVFATLFAVLLVQQTACEEVEIVEQPDELYILNLGSAFPYIVTDPSHPILHSDRRLVTRMCVAGQCQILCRSWGFRVGRCNAGVCVCSR